MWSRLVKGRNGQTFQWYKLVKNQIMYCTAPTVGLCTSTYEPVNCSHWSLAITSKTLQNGFFSGTGGIGVKVGSFATRGGLHR